MDLTALRKAIADQLTAGGVKAYEYTDTVTPPGAVVVPGQPYVEQRSGTQGIPFGSVVVTVDVLVLGQRDVNRTSAAKVDELIDQALAALPDRDVVRVSRPDVVTLNQVQYLGSVLTIEETTRSV